MSYKSILVNIAVDGPVTPVVEAAIGLARRFEARLIGLCAADIATPVIFPDGGVMVAEVWRQAQEDIEKRFGEARRAFERLTAGLPGAELRLNLRNPSQALIEASRAADLIVMAAPEGAASGDAYRTADPAGVVLRAGRPLLVVGDTAPPGRVVVAWKDSREARRAVADALPFLAAADDVAIVSVARTVDEEVRAGVEDVVAFLAAHGVEAKPELIERADEDAALLEFIVSRRPGLVVSGAYGHSRLREWAFGGVTRSLLDQAGLNRFMSS